VRRDSMGSNSNSMKRELGLKEAVTITVGTVVGVGLFTVGANGVGYLGPTIILATLTAFILSIYPSMLYAEMGAALPFAGGTYNFATQGVGKPWGMLAGWNFVISLIAVASGEALAFSNYFKWLLEGLGVPLNIDERIIASLVILIFTIINYRGVEIAGKWQNAFVFFFWGAAIVWFILMISKVNLSNYNPFSAPGGMGVSKFIMVTSLVWWCFAGFETACAMGGEIRYPQINIPRAMFLTPFIVFVVTAVFQWFLLGIMPASGFETLTSAAAPYAEGMKMAGILGLPLVLLCAGIAFGGDLSTINPSIAAPARYLFSMSRDGVLPPVFAKLHKNYKTPYVAVLFLGIIMLLFVATGSIIYVASLSLFADLFYYIIGFMSLIGLRVKRPNLSRPYKAPAGIAGAVISIIAYLIMMTQLPKDGIKTGIIWCAIGLAFYFIRNYAKRGAGNTPDVKEEDILSEIIPEMPPQPVMDQLNKEYCLWKNIVGIAFLATLLLYVFPYMISI
jgi:APA family basic amino acid/polyamine antiporter